MIIELTDLVITHEGNVVDFLAQQSRLSKSKVKTAMTRGAVWINRGGKTNRLRRAKARLTPGDMISLYYSEKVLDTVPPTPTLVDDQGAFSVWEKPAGLMSGGSRFGDIAQLIVSSNTRLTDQRSWYIDWIVMCGA